MSKVHPGAEPPAQAAQAAQAGQEQPAQPSAVPTVSSQASQINGLQVFAAVAGITGTGNSSPSVGMSPSQDTKKIAEKAKVGNTNTVVVFSHSRGGAKNSQNSQKSNVLQEVVDKFRYEISELKALLNMDAQPEDSNKNKDSKKLEALKKIINGDLSTLLDDLRAIHDLERTNLPADIINSTYVAFESIAADELVEYFKLRKQLAELKLKKRKFDEDHTPSKPKFISEFLNIPQLTTIDRKEIYDALQGSIALGNKLVLELVSIAKKTTAIVDIRHNIKSVAKHSLSSEMSKEQLEQVHQRRATTSARYLLIGSNQGGMEIYQNKVDEIRAKYAPCCSCNVM